MLHLYNFFSRTLLKYMNFRFREVLEFNFFVKSVIMKSIPFYYDIGIGLNKKPF